MRKNKTDDKTMMAVARRLRHFREKKGLSQEYVYIDTDYNIGRIETGKINITISTIAILCDYYGVKLSEFFAGIEIK